MSVCDRPSNPRRRIAALLQELVGRRTGIVRDLQLVSTIDGDAKLFHAAAALARPQPILNTNSPWIAGGTATTKAGAIMAALGEAVERYAASTAKRHLELQAEAELNIDSFSPSSFAHFSSEQRAEVGFPFSPPTANARLHWVPGNKLSDGGPIATPAQAVYLAYDLLPGETLITPGLSTGLACGDSLDQALLRGICEVVERDALAITWLKGLSPPRLDADWLNEQADKLLPPRDVVDGYDLTSDIGIPVVLIVCRGQGPRGPLISVGSSCHPDPRQAARKAALEASQDRVYVRQLVEQEPTWQALADYSNVTDFSFHARLYSVQPQIADAAFRFLYLNPRKPIVPAIAQEKFSCQSLAEVIAKLQNTGHHGAWFDLTPPEGRAIDMYVAKAVLPSLLPLHGNHRLAYLGHPRLLKAEAAMQNAICGHSYDFWPYPHPFA